MLLKNVLLHFYSNLWGNKEAETALQKKKLIIISFSIFPWNYLIT